MDTPDLSTTLPDTILAAAEAAGDGEFLRLVFPNNPDQALSYPELITKAEAWGSTYVGSGVQAGDRVIVSLPHSMDLYAAYIGAVLIGAVPAMFAFPSTKYSKTQYFESLDSIIDAAAPRAMVLFKDLVDIHAAADSQFPNNVAVLTPDDHHIRHTKPLKRPAIDPNAIAFIQYSSGTTGIKKGVGISHRALLWQVETYGAAIQANSNDRIISWLPLYHDMGLIACLMLPLILKIPIVAMSPFDWVRRPIIWAEIAASNKCTLSWLPNFAFSFMAKSIHNEDIEGINLSSLRGIVNCSEPIMAESHEAFISRFAPQGLSPNALATSYAMAENTFALTSGGFGSPPTIAEVDLNAWESRHQAIPAMPGALSKKIPSSGAPLPETDIQIVDDAGGLLPDGHAGEIYVHSPCLISNYVHKNDATDEAFVDNCFKTGDIGFMLNGELFVTGRKNDLIVIGGKNIYPQDIEELVNDIDGVIPGRVVALGVDDHNLGTQALVILLETEVADAQKDDLHRAVHEGIVTRSEVTPGEIVLLPHKSLVKSSSGKISRSANRELYLTQWRPASAADDTTGIGDVRLGGYGAEVHKIVRRILISNNYRSEIEAQTPLITSGLIDSFSMVELISDLEHSFNIRIPTAALESIDTLDTIAAIASKIEFLLKDTVPPDAPPQMSLSNDVTPMTYEPPAPNPANLGFWTLFNRLRLRRMGIKVGPGFQSLGPLILQILGKPENMQIGRNVTFMPGVHLKNREDGLLVLNDGVKLDTNVRLVVANQARLELGQNVALGMGTLINAGRNVLIGRGSLSGAYCVLNSSDHGIARGTPIQHQPYEHAEITVGEDVWLGAHVFVARGATIGASAVVSAGSVVAAPVPDNSIVQGTPARVIKFR